MARKKKTFVCYLCEQKTPIGRKGLEVGSGKFIDAICKMCSRTKYTIYEDSYFEEHDKMINEIPPRQYDAEEIIIRQIQFMEQAKRELDKHNGKPIDFLGESK